MAGSLKIQAGSTPATPAAGYSTIWIDSTTDKPYITLPDGNSYAVLTSDDPTVVRIIARNDDVVPITKGQALKMTGSQGQTPTVVRAQSQDWDPSNGSDNKFIGLANEAGAIGENFEIMVFGLLQGIDTDSLVEGDFVFVSTTAGSLTASRPAAPKEHIPIGICTRKAKGTSGSITVLYGNPPQLQDVHGIGLTAAPANKSVLQYDSTLGYFGAAPQGGLVNYVELGDVSGSVNLDARVSSYYTANLVGNTNFVYTNLQEGQRCGMILTANGLYASTTITPKPYGGNTYIPTASSFTFLEGVYTTKGPTGIYGSYDEENY